MWTCRMGLANALASPEHTWRRIQVGPVTFVHHVDHLSSQFKAGCAILEGNSIFGMFEVLFMLASRHLEGS